MLEHPFESLNLLIRQQTITQTDHVCVVVNPNNRRKRQIVAICAEDRVKKAQSLYFGYNVVVLPSTTKKSALTASSSTSFARGNWGSSLVFF